MIKDKNRMYLDIAVLVAFFVLVYYLSVRSGGLNTYSPYDAIQSFVGAIN